MIFGVANREMSVNSIRRIGDRNSFGVKQFTEKLLKMKTLALLHIKLKLNHL